MAATLVARHDRVVLRGAGWAAATLVATLAAVALSTTGHTFGIVGLIVIFLPLVLRAWPAAGVVILVVAATLFEHIGLLLPQVAQIGTDEIYFYQSLSDGIGLSGVLVTPLEMTLAVVLLILAVQAILTRRLHLRSAHLALAFAVFVAIVVLAAGRGLEQGADLRTVLREMRPWVYLGGGYLVASQLLNSRRAIWAIVWAFVISGGIKGIQGTYRFLVTIDHHPKLDYVISHEDAVFLTLFILVTAGLWLFGERGRLRWLATALLPAVLIADLANNRRTAWLMMPAGLALLLVIAWIRLPQRRPLLRWVAGAIVAISLVYVPVFWQSTSLWAQPVRAMKSTIAPDVRDKASNTYRQFENANILSNIKRSTPLGLGFGVPIDYSAIPFHDFADAVPALKFTPHNGILYVWMVLGIPGALAFWWLIGLALVVACRQARAPDPRMALFGAFVACALIAYLVEGYYDFGLWWFRVALLMGCLLGALEAAGRLSRETA